MTITHGLTTWIITAGRLALIWRWNMGLAEALRTASIRRRPVCCYMAAGPLIVEWTKRAGLFPRQPTPPAPPQPLRPLKL